ADQLVHVGAEVDRDAVREASAPSQQDPEAFAHGAARAVGRDEVAGANRLLGAVGPPPDRGGDTVAVRLERDELGAPLEPRAQLLRPALEQRLEPDLRDEEPR